MAEQGANMSIIPVFFKTEAVPADLITCKPMEKFEATAKDWAARFPDRLEFADFAPVTPDVVKLAHDPAHVDGVFDGTRKNGFGNRLPSVADAALWDVGAFVAAARHVASRSAPVAAVVGGGFHHAQYAYSHAFCTFCGLMIAFAVLEREGLAKKVSILDLDHHFGDGTQSIIDAKGWAEEVEHYSYSHQCLDAGGVDEWLATLPGVVRGFKERGADLLFYQAGADPHRDDPVARGVMTAAQLRERDRLVFGACAELGLPVAWVLAGGYQRPVEKTVALYRATMEECLAAFP
jgi:acetoin utilization deacetylase AcuC-like enzyme